MKWIVHDFQISGIQSKIEFEKYQSQKTGNLVIKNISSERPKSIKSNQAHGQVQAQLDLIWLIYVRLDDVRLVSRFGWIRKTSSRLKVYSATMCFYFLRV
jgi:hypothetical protein